MMRTFIALDISEEAKVALKAAEKAMGRLPNCRWVNPDTVHLTLKFLGDVEDRMMPEVFKVMREAAKGHRRGRVPDKRTRAGFPRGGARECCGRAWSRPEENWKK